MLISHEVPSALLNESTSFNDYEYCLLHLTWEDEEYREFYQNAAKKGRKIFLDNSIFELGDSLKVEDMIKGVKTIHPTWVVAPDALNNTSLTISRFLKWERDSVGLDVLTVGAVQGDSLSEMVRCYKFMAEHADKIAIPYDSKAFREMYPYDDPLESFTNGRPAFIKYLVDNGIWCNKPHHLFGCSYAREFMNPIYSQVEIESVDTSNPIVAGIEKLRYIPEWGLNTKPTTKLCELVDCVPNEEQREAIFYNITEFRKICKTRKKWVTFFSQTGAEICNLIEKSGHEPDLIVTNRENLEGVDSRVLKYKDRIVFLSRKPALEEYQKVLNNSCCTKSNCIITLHGYLRIIPEEICNNYCIFNLHPGLISKYPELRGFNPQEKAYTLGLPVSGAVIHRVTKEVDKGEILDEAEVNISGKTLEEVYTLLHDASTQLWLKNLKKLLE